MDYSCAGLAILVSAVLVFSCGQTDKQTDAQGITDASKRFTFATVVGVSKDQKRASRW